MSANTELQNAMLIYTLDLERFGVQHARDTVVQLKELEGELLTTLTRNDLTDFNRKRLTALLKGTGSTIDEYYTGISDTNAAAMSDVVKLTKKHSKGVIDGLLGADMVSIGLNPNRVSAIVRNTLIDGASAPDWWKEQGAKLDRNVEKIVRSGLFTGKTTQQIATDIRRAFGTPTNEATTLARTSVLAVNNDANLHTISDNKDIMKGLQWLSTLDGRTSNICKALDGLLWKMPDNYKNYTGYKAVGHRKRFPGPVAHWRERSTQVMVLKDASQIFDKPTEIPPTTRASVNGEVAETLTYETWLRKMPVPFQKSVLGPKRWQLWNDKKITTAELTDINNRPLTFEELEKKAGAGLVTPMINDDDLYDVDLPTDEEYSDYEFHTARAQKFLDDNGIVFEDKAKIQAEIDLVLKKGQKTYSRMIKASGSEYEKLAKEVQNLTEKHNSLTLRLTQDIKDKKTVNKLFSLLHARMKPEDIAKIFNDADMQVSVSRDAEDLFKLQIANFISLFQGRGLDYISTVAQHSSRAFYNSVLKHVDIGKAGKNSSILHELAHSLEYSDPRIFKATLAFVKARNKERGLKSMRELTGSDFYKASERAYEDEFIDLYVGKVYKDGTEVVSMGVQHFTNSDELLKLVRGDFEHFLLTLGIML